MLLSDLANRKRFPILYIQAFFLYSRGRGGGGGQGGGERGRGERMRERVVF